MNEQPTGGAAWDPPSAPPAPGPTAPEDARRRRRPTVAVLAIAGLGLGGLLVAGRLASADEPSTATTPPPDTTTGEPTTGDTTTPDPTTGDTTTGEPTLDDLLGGLPVFGELDLGALGECVAGELGLDVPADGGPPNLDRLGELTPEDLTAAWDACRSMLPDGVEQTIDDVTSCVADMVEQGRGTGEPFEPHGEAGVTVMTPDELSVLEFGEGDGSVTITKSGDDYTIDSSGDVSEIDLGSLDEIVADLHDSFAECDIALPFDLGDLGASGAGD